MTAPRPRVSVVVATHRLTPYLAQALASVGAQTFRGWEVIVVGDGVPDPAAVDTVVHETLGDAARTLHVPARGVSVARNAGTGAARGELVAFLDDDDVWHPERLARQVAALDADPAASACSCDGWVIGPDGERLPEPWPVTRGSQLDLLSGRVDIPRIVTLLFRRAELLAIGGFHPSFRIGEDNELILRAVLLGRLTAVPETLVGYRRHPGGATAAVGAQDDPGERLIRLTLDGAEAAGDTEAAAALAQNLRVFRARSAVSLAGTARHEARHRSWAPAIRAGAAAVRRDPATALLTLLLGPPTPVPPPPPAPAPTPPPRSTP